MPLVPSNKGNTRASRNMRSAGHSRVKPAPPRIWIAPLAFSNAAHAPASLTSGSSTCARSSHAGSLAPSSNAAAAVNVNARVVSNRAAMASNWRWTSAWAAIGTGGASGAPPCLRSCA